MASLLAAEGAAAVDDLGDAVVVRLVSAGLPGPR
jgi:hypothetical protein